MKIIFLMIFLASCDDGENKRRKDVAVRAEKLMEQCLKDGNSSFCCDDFVNSYSRLSEYTSAPYSEALNRSTCMGQKIQIQPKQNNSSNMLVNGLAVYGGYKLARKVFK